MDFDPNHPKWYCMCGRWHITEGAKIVAVLAVVKWLVHIIAASINISPVSYYYWGSGALLIPVLIALLYGTFFGKKEFLIPYMVFQLVNTGFLVIVVVFFVIGTIAQWKFMDNLADKIGNIDTDDPNLDHLASERRQVETGLIIDTLIMALIGLRFLFLIRRCYRFYRDQQRAVQMRELHYQHNNPTQRSMPHIISGTGFPQSQQNHVY